MGSIRNTHADLKFEWSQGDLIRALEKITGLDENQNT